MRTFILTGIAALSVTLAGCGMMSSEADDNIAKVKIGDVEIAAARAEARATLPEFWERLDKPTMFETNFGLKFNLHHNRPDLGNGELIWTSDVKRLKNGMVGAYLSNEPITDGYVNGQYVEFSEDAITDWQIEREGKFDGHYSTRILLAQASPEQAEAIKAMLW